MDHSFVDGEKVKRKKTLWSGWTYVEDYKVPIDQGWGAIPPPIAIIPIPLS
jgi:hypothetical protein